ncbi:Pup--protein ligase [Arcanobacterium hippocoleae]
MSTPLPKRIFGIETEYGITCASTQGKIPPLDAEDAAQFLFEPIVKTHRSTNAFLPNGARLYLDVGAHPEYATAECDALSDLLVNDRAGDEIFAQMAAHTNQQLAEKGIPGEIHLFKKNHDYAGNSFGCHENYLLRRRRDYRARAESLIPFFVTRQILVGAGYLFPGREQIRAARFEISQRAAHTFDAVSNSSTRSRPMVNTRDEPHGDAELYRRMHVIVGDSNMCEATAALKITMTEAVLNVLESGARFPDFTLAYPISAIRQTARDLKGKANIELSAGGKISSLQIQQAYYEKVCEVYAAEGWFAQLDETRRYAFELWERALRALETETYKIIETEIEWIAKYQLLEKYRERLSCGWDDLRLARIDLAWHDITAGGLRPSLETNGILKRFLDPKLIQVAQAIPPQTTRAKIRGDFIAAAMDARKDYFADWQNLKLINSESTQSVTLKDPFAAENAEVLSLIAEMEGM